MKPFVSAPRGLGLVSNHSDSAQMGTLKPKEGLEPRPGKEEPRTNLCPRIFGQPGDPKAVGSTGLFSFSSCPVYFRELSSTYISAPTLYLHSRGMVSTLSFSTNYTHKVQGKNLSDSTHRPLNAGPQDIAPGKGYRLPERGSAGPPGEARQAWGQVKGEPGLPNLPGWECRMEKGNWGPGVWCWGENWALTSSKGHHSLDLSFLI